MAKVEINAGGRTVSIETGYDGGIDSLSEEALTLWQKTDDTGRRGHAAFGFVAERRPQYALDASPTIHAEGAS